MLDAAAGFQMLVNVSRGLNVRMVDLLLEFSHASSGKQE
jgi:hypothetical protein